MSVSRDPFARPVVAARLEAAGRWRSAQSVWEEILRANPASPLAASRVSALRAAAQAGKLGARGPADPGAATLPPPAGPESATVRALRRFAQAMAKGA